MTKLLWPAINSLSSTRYALRIASRMVAKTNALLAKRLNAESAVAESAAGLYQAILQAHSSGTDDDWECVHREYVRLGELGIAARKLWIYGHEPNPE